MSHMETQNVCVCIALATHLNQNFTIFWFHWLAWTGLAWPGLAWPGLDWPGLAWSGLAWPGLVWTVLDWPGLDWTGLDWPGLAWPGLDWTEPGCPKSTQLDEKTTIYSIPMLYPLFEILI